MRSNLLNFAVCLGIGTVSAIPVLLTGMTLLQAGLQKTAMFFLWPYAVVRGLMPCLPAGDLDCTINVFHLGFLGFVASAVICGAVAYWILFRRPSMTSNNRWRGP